MNHFEQPPTLAVLAGGTGSRMGRPKSLLQINGQPILEMILDHCDWPGPTLLVTSPSRENPPGCKKFQLEAVDEVSDQGPLRGLLTALRACRTRLLIAATVDMPQIARVHLEWLCQQLNDVDTSKSNIMLAQGERIEPFPSLWQSDRASTIESLINLGTRSMRMLAEEPWVNRVQIPRDWPAETWTNLNYPADLQKWLDHQSAVGKSA